MPKRTADGEVKSEQYLSAGLDTFKIPASMFKENRDKACDMFGEETGMIFLVGGETQFKYDTDAELVFRQESFFRYLFGVIEPGCFGALDIQSRKCTIFFPRLPEAHAIFEGVIYPNSHFKTKYSVDEVKYVDEILSWFQEQKPSKIHTLLGTNSDSGSLSREATFEGIEQFKVDNTQLYDILVECRVIKSKKELELMCWVNKVASEAHMQVMRKCKPNMMEYQFESTFLHESYYNGGHRFTAYTCICGAGHSGATLHYGQNDKISKDGDINLLDMGGEYFGYASDITCSFPTNGKFSPEQREIYETVLASQKAVMAAMKPGVSWPDMHRLSERVILEKLKEFGFLKGDVDEMMEKFMGSVFMPHGLGHFMGLDVHDCGGYPKGTQRSTEPGLRSLRCGRELKAGMVLTVEPGVYFIDAVLDPAMADEEKSKFFVKEKINKFRGFGGVRLEDDVIVTETGIKNMTLCPREIEDIEKLMAEDYIVH
eukprot:Nk52_evm4s704 gene=Nk52_evmTU4s704